MASSRSVDVRSPSRARPRGLVTTMFLGVSHAGGRTDSIPACPTEFIKAWNAWDPTDPAKMPPLPEKPCLLIEWDHVYICSQEDAGCVANKDSSRFRNTLRA